MENFYGIRLFNDDVTPMEKVVSLLEGSLSFSPSDAFDAMVAVHQENGFVVLMAEREEVEERAAELSAAIRATESTLRFDVVGPFTRLERDKWKRELRDAANPKMSRNWQIFSALLGLIGLVLFIYCFEYLVRWGSG